MKVPAGFDTAIFATAPAVDYPVFIATAPGWHKPVSSDGNGSLDRVPGRGVYSAGARAEDCRLYDQNA